MARNLLNRWYGPRRIVAGGSLALALGCGGGAPLLHGAHTLAPGSKSAGAGLSGTFAAGEASAVIESAHAPEGAFATVDERNAAIARAGAVLAALAPSVAPWASARIGLPRDSEAGLSYTGRGVRLDARHAFEAGAFAVSVGAGASALLPGHEQTVATATTKFRTGFDSFGFDVPVLVGWRSTAGVVSLWAGARGGGERIGGDVSWERPGTSSPRGLDLNRWYAGTVIGMTVGFRHVHGALELDTYYQWIKGAFADLDISVTGVTIAPAGALIVTF